MKTFGKDADGYCRQRSEIFKRGSHGLYKIYIYIEGREEVFMKLFVEYKRGIQWYLDIQI